MGCALTGGSGGGGEFYKMIWKDYKEVRVFIQFFWGEKSKRAFLSILTDCAVVTIYTYEIPIC